MKTSDEDDLDARIARIKIDERPQQWERVRGGLNSIFFGLLLLLLLVAVAAMFLLVRNIPFDRSTPAVPIVAGILGMTFLGALFFMIVGFSMTMAAPDVRASRLVKAQSAMLAAVVPLCIVYYAMVVPHQPAAVSLFTEALLRAPLTLAQFCFWLALVLQMLFLRRLGQIFADRSLIVHSNALAIGTALLGSAQMALVVYVDVDKVLHRLEQMVGFTALAATGVVVCMSFLASFQAVVHEAARTTGRAARQQSED